MRLLRQHQLPVSSTAEQEKLAWLRLIRTENIGPVTFYRLIETYGSAIKALEALPHLAKRGGRSKPLTPCAPEHIEQEYEGLMKFGAGFVCAFEENYPALLSQIDDAPPVLTFSGNLDLLKKTSVGIVGSRNASLNGRKFTAKLAHDLGETGVTVISGLARGIDTAAHEGSLATGTVAILGGGLDIIYPPENKDLYARIREEGLLIAESPFGQQPFAQSFPRRNRIISGLSRGVAIIEATFKSGSLITARMAGEQGREVLAVPGHPLDPRAEGPNALIREGATLVRNADDILEALKNYDGGLRDSGNNLFMMPPIIPQTTPALDEQTLDHARDDVLGILSVDPVNIDEMIRATGLPSSAVQIIILELELAGKLQRLHGNRIALLA